MITELEVQRHLDVLASTLIPTLSVDLSNFVDHDGLRRCPWAGPLLEAEASATPPPAIPA